jgi:hypothetical protein
MQAATALPVDSIRLAFARRTMATQTTVRTCRLEVPSRQPQDHLAVSFTRPAFTPKRRERGVINPHAHAFTHLKGHWRSCLAALSDGRGNGLVGSEADGNADHRRECRVREQAHNLTAAAAKGWSRATASQRVGGPL